VDPGVAEVLADHGKVRFLRDDGIEEIRQIADADPHAGHLALGAVQDILDVGGALGSAVVPRDMHPQPGLVRPALSQYGSLKSTVEHIVNDSEAGRTHPELELSLKVRVHNTLLDIVEAGRIGRKLGTDLPAIREEVLDWAADDFEHLPAEAALAYNLTKPDYVKSVCGSLEKLPDAFADLDIAKRSLALGTTPSERTATVEEPRADFASLPRADRRVVRAESLRQRIEAAAQSRAPRRLVALG